MAQLPDFKSLQEQIQTSLVATTRTAGQISSEDLAFQRSLNPHVGTALDEQGERLLELSTKLLKSAASISDVRAPDLEELDDVESNWRSVVDVIDSLLEKTDTCLDEYTGMIKRKEQSPADQASADRRKNSPGLSNTFRNQNLIKPQLAFDIKPDNQDNSPWRPILTLKPHAIVPLEESLDMVTNDLDQKQYRHPYETEILQLQYPDCVYQKAEPIMYQPIDTTSAIWVDTEEGMLEMLEELKTASEIAVDLEHHDTRSFVGLVSLMQISTRKKDWIVDTLKPWRHKLQVLNEVFTDPKIMKVFHGAYMDIVWLQRDLGLYIVGLFDTHWASRTLGYQGGSLAFLLKKFINFDADKKYQLADWRIRPLPDEMFYYARSDTHFLLYIYDNMRNELLDRTNPGVPEENRIEMALQQSKEVSLLRYERQIYNAESGKGPGGWYSLLVKTPGLFNQEQFSVFRAVHQWRDQVARADDDSTAFVLPNHVIFSIAKIIPTDLQALLGLARPTSQSVKSRVSELFNVIKEAKAKARDGPEIKDVFRANTVGPVAKANMPSIAAKDKSLATEPLIAAGIESDLRSSDSTFWGEAFGSSIWDKSTPVKRDHQLRLAVPLPQLSPSIFEVKPDPFSQEVKTNASVQLPIQASSPKPKADETFVLKRGAKRKSEAISESEAASEPDEHSDPSSASGSEAKTELVQVNDDAQVEEAEDSAYDISFSGTTEALTSKNASKISSSVGSTKTLTKAQKRKLRKVERQREKAVAREVGSAQPAAETGDDAEGGDEEPFDYSKAESVLHAKKKHNTGELNGKGGKEKPFDPYSKSANAPKGMRRAQKERTGKSHTFKH